MCDGSDYIEHCYMLPSRWKDLLEYDIIGDKICANFQNACCTPIEFFVEENFESQHMDIDFFPAFMNESG